METANMHYEHLLFIQQTVIGHLPVCASTVHVRGQQ